MHALVVLQKECPLLHHQQNVQLWPLRTPPASQMRASVGRASVQISNAQVLDHQFELGWKIHTSGILR
jgi:hypothetical protein